MLAKEPLCHKLLISYEEWISPERLVECLCWIVLLDNNREVFSVDFVASRFGHDRRSLNRLSLKRRQALGMDSLTKDYLEKGRNKHRHEQKRKLAEEIASALAYLNRNGLPFDKIADLLNPAARALAEIAREQKSARAMRRTREYDGDTLKKFVQRTPHDCGTPPHLC